MGSLFLTFQLIDPGHYTVNEIIELHNNGTIILESKKLLEAIKEKVEPKTPPFDKDFENL